MYFGMPGSIADIFELRPTDLCPGKMLPAWLLILMTINQSGLSLHSISWIESDTGVWAIADVNGWNAG